MIDVLVCDHHRLFGEAFAAALRAAGAQVRVASDPVEALAALSRAPADRVVMSAHFPDGAGLHAIRQVRQTWPSTHVTCLGTAGTADTESPTGPERASGTERASGPERTARVDAERTAGAHALLSKNCSLRDLVEAVLRGRAAPGSHVVPATRHRPAMCTSRVGGPLAARFLTDRERDVLKLLVGAQKTDQIAAELGISVTTTRGYVQSILGKLGVHSRVQAVSYAVRHSVVS